MLIVVSINYATGQWGGFGGGGYPPYGGPGFGGPPYGGGPFGGGGFQQGFQAGQQLGILEGELIDRLLLG